MSAGNVKGCLESLNRLQQLLVVVCLSVMLCLGVYGHSCLAFDNRYLLEDAETGDSEAQYTLAQLYLKGQGGVEKSITSAITWFRRAAESGHEDSMYSLAMLLLAYNTDNGLRAESYSWLKKAADAGHAESQYALGRAYGAHAPDKGIYWLKQAVLNGHSLASKYLSELCEENPNLCD